MMTLRRFFSLIVLTGLLLASAPASAQPSRAGDIEPASDYEAALTTILQAIVTDDGLVRYHLLEGPHRAAFRRVLKAIEDFDAATLRSPAQKQAFWMNAYNVQMLQNILETPGVGDILAEGHGEAFFKTPFRTARLGVSLDELENVILRGQPGRAPLKPYQLARLDPRIHVGLNCAAISCPRLRRRAFTADNLNAELDAALRDFVASPRHFRVAGEAVVLSSLLDWYGADFDRPGQPAGDYLLAVMPPTRAGYARLRAALEGRPAAALKAAPGVRFEYLWTVNRAE